MSSCSCARVLHLELRLTKTAAFMDRLWAVAKDEGRGVCPPPPPSAWPCYNSHVRGGENPSNFTAMEITRSEICRCWRGRDVTGAAAPMSRGTTAPVSPAHDTFPHRLWTDNKDNFLLKTETRLCTHKSLPLCPPSLYGSWQCSMDSGRFVGPVFSGVRVQCTCAKSFRTEGGPEIGPRGRSGGPRCGTAHVQDWPWGSSRALCSVRIQIVLTRHTPDTHTTNPRPPRAVHRWGAGGLALYCVRKRVLRDAQCVCGVRESPRWTGPQDNVHNSLKHQHPCVQQRCPMALNRGSRGVSWSEVL